LLPHNSLIVAFHYTRRFLITFKVKRFRLTAIHISHCKNTCPMQTSPPGLQFGLKLQPKLIKNI
jgi:hypothetical protein